MIPERRRSGRSFFEELDVVGAFTYDEKEDALAGDGETQGCGHA